MSGISARELDRLARVSESQSLSEGHSSLIESGRVENVSMITATALARVLGVSLDWLINGEGKRPTERGVRAAVENARLEQAKPSTKPAA